MQRTFRQTILDFSWLAHVTASYGHLCLCLIGFFGWVVAVPLYGSAGIAWAAAQGTDFSPLPLWFLAGNIPASIAAGLLWDRAPNYVTHGLRLAAAAAALLTILLIFLPPATWPALYVLMGISMAGLIAWARVYATAVQAGWFGRVFGLAAAGVNVVRWIFDALARDFTLGPWLVLLTLIPLALCWLKTPRLAAMPAAGSPPVPIAVLTERTRIRTAIRYGLFIIFMSLTAGFSYSFLTYQPPSPYLDDILTRAPYIVAVMIAGHLIDRRGLHTVLVLGGLLLALSHLIMGWGRWPVPAYIGARLQGVAFGLAEPAPWVLLASLAGTATAGRWFGWGLNLNVIPILAGGLLAQPLGRVTPEQFSLLAAAAMVLALMALNGVTDPLEIARNWLPLAAVNTQPQREPAASGPAVPRPEPPMPVPPPAAAAPLPIHRRLVDTYGPLLSAREIEVARLAILGVATRDIAQQLHLSENTIKTHLKNIYRKTETANRNDLYRRLTAGSHYETIP